MKKIKFITSIITMLVLILELGFGVLATTGNIYPTSQTSTYVENRIEKTDNAPQLYSDRECSHSEPVGAISSDKGVSIVEYFNVIMNGSLLVEDAIVDEISHGRLKVSTPRGIIYDSKTGKIYLDKTYISTEIGSHSNEYSVTLSMTDDVKDEVHIPVVSTVNSWEEIEDVAGNYSATCGNTGWENKTICSVCSQDIKAGNKTAQLGHDLDNGTEKVKATCITNGITIYKCQRQGCTYTEEREDIEKLGHNFTGDYVTDQKPTCEQAGSKSKHCTRCGYVESTETIPELGHNWNSGEITKVATCTEEGVKTYICQTCGKEKEEAISKTPHEYDEGVITTYSDCTNKGIKTYTCVICNQTKVEDLELDTTKHSFTSEVTTRPTCDSVGVKTYTCSRCSYSYTEEIQATGHTESDVILDVKMGENGYSSEDDLTHICYYKTYCTTCGETMTQTKESVSHTFEIISYPEDSQKGNWSDWIVIQNATCTTEGRASRSREVYDYPTVSCSLCAHTCISTEKHLYSPEKQEKAIPVLGHDFASDYTIDLAPTCIKEGIKSKHCSRCSQVDDEQSIEALGHFPKPEEIDTQKGISGYEKLDENQHTCHYKVVCSVCEETIETRTENFEHNIEKTQKMSETTHGDWSEWTIVENATCLEVGTKTRSRINTNYPIYECTICKYEYSEQNEPNNTNETDTQTIPVLGHSYDSEITVKATCTTDGKKTMTCIRCGDCYEEVILATGHKDGTEIIDIGKGINGFESLASEGHICYYKTPCSVCGLVLHTRSQTIAHTPTLKGYTTETKYSDWSDWTITLNPTCTENGSKFHTRETYNYPMYACSDCMYEYTGEEKHSLADETETEAISSLGHDFASEFTIDVKAKCISDGSKSKHCSRCDAKSDVTVIPATGHSLSEKVINTQKGVNGYEYYSSEQHTCNYKALCANCDYIEYTQENLVHSISSTGKMTDNAYSEWSEWEIIENATCLVQGSHKHTRTKTDYPIYACSLCEYTYEDKTAPKVETETKTEVIPALGHDHIKEITIQVTCEVDGLITYTCSRGDDTYTETVKATGHSWNEGTTTRQPTCEIAGIKTITCNTCQKTKTESISALGHKWNDGEVTTIADCITEGVMTFTCDVCSKTKDEKFGIDADNHNYEDSITTEPTCLDTGIRTYTCSRCEHAYTEKVNALGHDFDDGTITTKPTCEETGIKTFTCKRCDATETETVKANGHTFDDGIITTEANCTTDGIKTYKCTVCGKEKTENLGKDTTKHNYIEKITTPAKCEEKGLKTFTCSRCGHSYTEEIPETGHTSGSEIIDIGKGIQGYEDLNNGKHLCYYRTPCSVCNKTLSERTQDFDHDMEVTDYTEEIQKGEWTDFEVTVEPTCLNVGSQIKTRKVWNYAIKTCTLCKHTETDTEPHYLDNETETEEIKALGHDYQYNITLQAKCEEKGSQIVTCSRCDYNKTEEIPETGHKWNDGVITLKATCTATGKKVYKCTVCEKENTETLDIDTTNHDYIEVITTPAKCEEKGLKTFTCSRCEHSYTEEIPATGHTAGDEVVDIGKGIQGYEDLGNGKHKCYYHIICTVCKKELKTNTEDYDHITTHTSNTEYTYGEFGSWTQTTAPTCLAQGEMSRTRPMWNYPIYTCTFCSYSYTDENDMQMSTDTETSVVEALGHEYATEFTTDTPATCITLGSKSKHCLRCGDKSEITEIPLAEHKYNNGEITLEATCTKTGTKLYTCSVCQGEKADTINALGHNFAENYTIDKEATCKEVGSKSQHCTRCEEKQSVTEIPLAEHKYDNGEITLEATCTKTGTKLYTCSVCQGEKTDTISALGHNFAENYTTDKEATCKEVGSKSQHCTRCEEKQNVTEIPLAEHKWNDGVITLKATCTTKGEKTYTCSVCKITKTEEYESETKEHIYESKITKEPTCTEKGTKTYTCSLCGDSYTEDIDATGHTSGGEIIDIGKGINGYKNINSTQHTCYYITKCSVCKETISTREANENHETSKNYTGTYTSYSSSKHTQDYTITCSLCSYSDSGSDSAVSHSWNSGKTTTYATCISEGEKLYTCTDCGRTKTETIEKTSHDTYTYSAAVSADTHKVGKTAEIRCKTSGCDYSSGGSEISPTHNGYMSYSSYKAATCEDDGHWESYYCSYCSNYYDRDTGDSEKISALGHKMEQGSATGDYTTYTTTYHKKWYNTYCSRSGCNHTDTDWELDYHDKTKDYTDYSTYTSSQHKHNYNYECSLCGQDTGLGSSYDLESHDLGSKSYTGYTKIDSTNHKHNYTQTCSKCKDDISDYDKETHTTTTDTSYESQNDTYHTKITTKTCSKDCGYSSSSKEINLKHDYGSQETDTTKYRQGYDCIYSTNTHYWYWKQTCSLCEHSKTGSATQKCTPTNGTSYSYCCKSELILVSGSSQGGTYKCKKCSTQYTFSIYSSPKYYSECIYCNGWYLYS